MVDIDLAGDTQQAATQSDMGQNGKFLAEFTAVEELAQLTGNDLGSTYLASTGQFSKTVSGEAAQRELNASNVSPEAVELAQKYEEQLDAIRKGEQSDLSIPFEDKPIEVLKTLGILSGDENIHSDVQEWARQKENDPTVSVDPQTGNYTVPVKQSHAQLLNDATNEPLMKFVGDNRAAYEAAVVHGGMTLDGNIADLNSESGPSIADSRANAGNNVREDNSLTMHSGLVTDMQTVVDGVLSENPDVAARMLETGVESDATQKEMSHLLGQMFISHLNQNESDSTQTSTGAEAQLYAGIGKKSLANAADNVIDDTVEKIGEGAEVPDKTPPTGEGSGGKKGGWASKILSYAPVDFGVRGNLSATAMSTDNHNSEASTNVIEAIINAQLEEYQNSERTAKDVDKFQEFYRDIVSDDRAISNDALNEFQNDEVENALDPDAEANRPRNAMEETLDGMKEKFVDYKR
jgi:hypothetical protein